MKVNSYLALAAAVVGLMLPSLADAATLSYEAEALAVTNSGSGTSLQTDANTSGGQWVSLNATGTGSWMEFTLANVPAGTYTLRMSYKTNNNRGQATVKVDGTQVGGTIEQYAALPSTYPEATLGTVVVAVTGDHKVRLTVAGKSSASSSYVLSADKFTLDSGTTATPTPTPTPAPGVTPTPGATRSFEAEALAVTNSGVGTAPQTDANTSGGRWIALNATGTGAWMELTLPGISTGTYTLKMRYKTNNNRGQLTLRVDGTQLGGTLDQYASPSTYPEATFGTVTFGAAGDHKVRLTVVGKSSSSTSYVLSADNFTLQSGSSPNPTPTPTPTSTPVGPTPSPTPTPTPAPTPTPTPGTGGGNFPARFSAPYVETWNNNNLATIASSTGHKFFTLAFIINGSGSCNPTWNGDTSLTGNSYGSYINSLRGLGGDVIVSFGGASGTEIGNSCGDVASLQAAYQKVINQFNLTWIDLDIEGGAMGNTTAIDRRNKAMHNLQVANPKLRISYTLAVDPTGLPSGQVNLLKNAMTNGARVDVVNIMAMDYGPCGLDMGQTAIQAAQATRNQLSGIGLGAKVGITPMIGVNDVTCEVFSTSDAQETVTYAQANSYVGLLAYWALGSDSSRSYLNIFKTFH